MQNFESAIQSFFSAIFSLFITISISVAVVCFAWGALTYMTSGGNVRRSELANAAMAAAIIGLLLVLSAGAFGAFIQSTVTVSPIPTPLATP